MLIATPRIASAITTMGGGLDVSRIVHLLYIRMN
jgi:hypothetical protein